MKGMTFKRFAYLSLALFAPWSSSVYADWGYISRANCFFVNESITWNRTWWDGQTAVLFVESWHKRTGAAADTADRVTDGWERNSQHVRAGDSHLYLDYQVIGRHYESLPSGFIRLIRTDAFWCHPLTW